MKLITQEKEIGALLSKLASHDMHLVDVADGIQGQVDSLKIEVRNATIKECANIAWALSVGGHGPTSKPKLMARNIFNNIMSLVRE